MRKTGFWRVIATTSAVVIALGLVTAGCAAPAARDAAAPPPADGAQLWAQTCMRCHNVRSPSMYSDAQWDVIMLHMRVRANLTAEDHAAILAFLKSAH
jgi:hypothetical protein